MKMYDLTVGFDSEVITLEQVSIDDPTEINSIHLSPEQAVIVAAWLRKAEKEIAEMKAARSE